MNKYALSFIIPVFNTELKILKRCLKSFESINEEIDYEILFINDGSEKNKSEEYKSLCKMNSNIKYIYKDNGGVSSARNMGMQRAQGKYIFFVDADDCIEGSALKKEDINSEVDLILYNIKMYSNSRTKYSIVKLPGISKYPSIKQVVKFSFQDGLLNWVWGKLYLRDFLIKNDCVFDKNMVNGEDYDFLSNVLIKKPTIKYCDSTIYQYYFTSNSGTMRTKLHSKEILKDANKMFVIRKKLISLFNFEDKYLSIATNAAVKAYYEVYATSHESADKNKIIKKYLNEIDIKDLSKLNKLKFWIMIGQHKKISNYFKMGRKLYRKINPLSY
ncbi:glycosyltransferase family 2 protein [Lactobacillus gasseri]|uniref:glycosyltransferase family 2 protein n=1 Tax=Lactobacillus gasseri TaxID=1596 RepID=UPI00164765CF|nr:glycosyltransferase family 2 protein [Lactobacillus gasseri]